MRQPQRHYLQRPKKQKQKQQGQGDNTPKASSSSAAAPVFTFRPIGFIRSSFPGCRGVPRQGALAPLTRATLELCRDIQPCALDGLEQWSHLWVSFVFHRNRTSGKASSTGQHMKFKIAPPKYTSKVGIFATRSPHRVNPIGQTIVRVERVNGRCLDLRGVDLVDGTPVLDIKPYVPAYESVPEARMAPWVSTAYDARRLDVCFSQAARQDLEVGIVYGICTPWIVFVCFCACARRVCTVRAP